MQILQEPNDALRAVSTEVQVFDSLLQYLVNEMAEQMYASNGIGLAAPQIGINKRLVIIDPSGGDDAKQFLVMVNPRITAQSGKSLSTEGCLSIPGVQGEVERFAEIDVEFQTITGEKQKLCSLGKQAIIIQHEIDHLDGVLFTDKVKGIRRLTLRKMR